MKHPQFILNLAAKLVIVLFAGAGGSCTGIEKAIGRHVDIAANHNDDAMSCHKVNHPQTRHYIEDVRVLNPRELTGGRPVGYFHVSPDCTHFSQAKGGQPRDKAIRSLPWVTIKWAGTVRPEVITLENVKEIRKWGPLIAKRDKATGRVVKLDLSVAAPGEHVPLDQQFLIPDPKRQGQTWRRFLAILREMGYDVEDKVLCAADFDVPQRRNRLFMVARCDGKPIVWPAPVRVEKPKVKGQQRWRGAHECIDFKLPSKSIFVSDEPGGRKRPLAAATLKRVARGLDKFVLNCADPFIVPATHHGSERVNSVREPLPTVTAANRGELMLVSPVVAQVSHGEAVNDPAPPPTFEEWYAKTAELGGSREEYDRLYGERGSYIVTVTHTNGRDRVHDVKDPLPVITTAKGGEFMVAAPVLVQASHGEGKPDGVKRWGAGVKDMRDPTPVVAANGGQSVATAFLARQGTATKPEMVSAFVEQANGGFNVTHAKDARDAMSVVTTSGSQQRLVSASMITLRNHGEANDVRGPIPVVSAGGEHHGLVEVKLSPEQEEGALRCAAFIIEYYSEGGQWSDLKKPINTLTTADRMALVTVWIKGDPYVVVDICLRMLVPRELANATSLPPEYILERGHDGRKFTKTKQVRMIGNAVPPELQYHVTAANYTDEPERMLEAA